MADLQITTQLVGLTDVQTGLQKIGAGLDALGTSAQTASRSFQQIGTDLATVGAKITLVTAPLALFGKGLLTSAGDYEAAMNRLGVISDATADQLARVGEVARQIGAETTFAASDAVDAFMNLSKNGITLEDSLNGVAQAAVDLAAATKTDLGFAADVAAKAMQQFGASAGELPRMMDQLYNATKSSTFELGDMALALGQAGGVASKAGVDFGEFNTAIAVISPSFFSGADAGTSFKVMLTNLVPQTKAAAEMAKELGLNFQDANGNFLPMRDIVAQLQTAFAGLSESQRIEAAQTLFGTDSMRAALALASSGVEVWDKYAAEIDKTGTTHAAAVVAMQGFNGALEQVRGAVENLGNALAASGFLDWVTKAILGIANFINWIAELPAPVLNTVAAISAMAVALGPLLVALGGVMTALGFAAAGFAALVSPIGLAVVAIAAVGAAAYVFRDEIGAAFTAVAGFAADLWQSWDGTMAGLVQVLEGLLVDVAGWATDFATSIGAAAAQAGEWLIQEVTSWDLAAGLTAILVAVAEWATDFAVSVGEAAVQAGQWLIDEVSSWDLAAGLDALLTLVAAWASDFATSVGEAAAQAGDWLVDEVSSWDLGSGLDALLTAVAEWASDFATSVGEAAAQAGDWLVEEVESWDLAAGLDELLSIVAGWATDFATSVGEAAAQAGEWLLDEVADWDIGDALGDILVAVAEWAGDFATSVAETAVQAGDALLDAVSEWDITGPLDEIIGTVADWTGDFYDTIVGGLGEAYDGAVSVVQAMADSVVEWFAGLPGRIAGTLTNLAATIINPFQVAWDAVSRHSIVPDMVDDVLDHFGRMVAGIDATTRGLSADVTATFSEMSAGIARETSNIAHSIADTDWGLDAKMEAFAQLEAAVVKTGEKGTEAMAELRQIMADTVADAAADRLREALDAVGVSTEEQLAKVLALRNEFAAYGEVATDALAEITEKAQELYEELANQQIDQIFDNTTLTMREQLVELENLRQHYVDMGTDGAAAAAAVSEEIEKLGAHVAALDDVLGGVETALAENIDAWGGWGETAHDIVSGFSDGAKDVLADFFETGKLDIEDLGNTFKRVLAEEAAEAVVSFASDSIKSFLEMATKTNESVTTIGNQFTGMTTTTSATWSTWLTGLGGAFTGFTGQMGGWISGIGTWFSGLFTTTDAGWSGWLGGLGGDFTGWVGQIGGWISGIVDWFGGMFTETGGGWSGWLGQLGGMFSGLFGEGGGLSGILDGAVGLFNTFFGQSSGGMSGMLTSMLSGLGGLFGGGGGLSGLLSTASGLFGTFFGQGSGGMSGMIGTMASALTSLFGGGGTLSGLMGVAGNLLGTFFTSGTAGGAGMIGNLTGMFSGLFGAGGTLSGLFSGGAGAFAALFANPVTAAGVGVAAALGVAFVAFGGEFGDLMSNIKNLAVATWDAIKTAFGAALDVMKGVFQAFAGVLTGLFNALKTLATGIFDAIKTAFGAAIGVMEGIFRAFAGVLTALLGAIKTAATVAFEAIRAAFGALMGAMESLLRAFAAVAGGVFAAILNVAKLAFTGIAGAAGAAVNVMGGALTTFAHGAAAVFGAVLNVGVAAFQRLAAFAGEAINGILRALQGLMSTLSGALAFAGNVFSQILGLANNLADAIRNLFGGVADTIGDVFRGLTGGMPRVILDWIGTIGDELGLGDIKDLLHGIGGFLEHIPGLDDLVDGLSDIFDSIGDLFDDIFDFFHEGGRVGGSGDVPVMAKAGEWIINPEASERYNDLLEAINSGQMDKAVAEAASRQRVPFKAFASGGDAILHSPTLILGGEKGPERASFRPLNGSGPAGNERPIVFNGPVIADDMSMGKFSRNLLRDLERQRKRLYG